MVVVVPMVTPTLSCMHKAKMAMRKHLLPAAAIQTQMIMATLAQMA